MIAFNDILEYEEICKLLPMYFLRKLNEEQTRQVEEHLQTCDDCRIKHIAVEHAFKEEVKRRGL